MSETTKKPLPRLILCREAGALEVAAFVNSFNDEYQVFGPLPDCPFPDSSIEVIREGEDPIHFCMYELEILKKPEMAKGFRPGKAPNRGTVTAYCWARDYGNFVQFCERVLKIEVKGKPEEN